ncbi:hypothetical protein DFH11DRAFT_1808798 [Phellopilus nigrolimitatus]|nr:hypothetical protein DFH11DRAFT_1808798 [Phellopilus nigrolimitatus]
MSSYDHHHPDVSRPHPYVSIPPPPPPKEPKNGARLHRSPSTSWLAYAAAANAQLDAYDSYDGDATPSAPRNRNDFLSAEPYSPVSPYLPSPYGPENGHGNGAGGYPYSGIQQPNGHGYNTSGAQPPAAFVEGSSGGGAGGLSSFDPGGGTFAFPEPEIHRSVSQRDRPPSVRQAPRLHQRQTLSDIGPAVQLSRSSSHSSYAASMDHHPEDYEEELTDELSHMTLDSDEGLRRFQAGELPSSEEEWHRLVPETAREALGEREVQRQSILFEIFKSERDYVSDLEAVIDVFIEPLRAEKVIGDSEQKTDEFVQHVFWNLSEVLSFHQRMLGSLFARQRDQHPLVQSVSDTILETALQFQPAYESYIKHYPLSEAQHRSELKRNPAYRAFLQHATQDPRIRKRDLVTFLSRPVTRLPRLVLLLESLLKKTDEDHPDQETMPLIIGILSDFVKSTQPGIEAAEAKVKFWSVMENLVFRKGEIIDLDDQDAGRSLIHSQTLARRQRTEIDWSGWNDYFVVLLDHYPTVLITREEKRTNTVRYEVSSRPIPLEFLRLGQFDEPAEARKERSDEGGLLDNLRSHTRPQYPFTVYHSAAKLTRRYTLYTNTEAARNKWHDALVNAIAIHKVQRDANKWFAPNTVNDGVFRVRSVRVPPTSTELFTGAITAAAIFAAEENYTIVGCTGGVYVFVRGEIKFSRVLTFQNVSYIAALQNYNKILIHTDGILLSYSMDILARVSQGGAAPQALDASMERVSGQDNVTVAKVGIVKDRTIVVYATRSFRQTTVFALEAAKSPIISRLHPGKSTSFKSFGQSFYVPRQVVDIIPLSKTVAVIGDKGVTIIDPTNLSSSALLVVPDVSNACSDDRMAMLKDRVDDAKPLGIARVDKDESMVIYEDFGCYIERHGFPTRKSAIVRWETKAAQFAERGAHILLFSADLVEVRHKATGRLVQVLEGRDVRLLNVNSELSGLGADAGPADAVPLLVARYGTKHDVHGQSIELLELMKTTELMSPASNVPNGEEYWGEWDM